MNPILPTQRRAWLAGGLAILIVAAAAAPLQAQEDISKVNGGISVDAGQRAGDLSTVNGGISLDENAVAGSAETVNGGIRLGDGARVASVESVNGGIRMGEGAQVEGELESVNGSITLLPQAAIAGNLTNVNGTISLDAARVGGKLTTTNGSILIGSGSVVEGGLLVRKPRGRSTSNRPPRVVIGPDAEVRGSLVFEREVSLFVHDRARIGTVEGATAQRFSGAEPPAQ
jgi:DUF4097 and DUF4098 domain-containing protein YvlB